MNPGKIEVEGNNGGHLLPSKTEADVSVAVSADFSPSKVKGLTVQCFSAGQQFDFLSARSPDREIVYRSLSTSLLSASDLLTQLTAPFNDEGENDYRRHKLQTAGTAAVSETLSSIANGVTLFTRSLQPPFDSRHLATEEVFTTLQTIIVSAQSMSGESIKKGQPADRPLWRLSVLSLKALLEACGDPPSLSSTAKIISGIAENLRSFKQQLLAEASSHGDHTPTIAELLKIAQGAHDVVGKNGFYGLIDLPLLVKVASLTEPEHSGYFHTAIAKIVDQNPQTALDVLAESFHYDPNQPGRLCGSVEKAALLQAAIELHLYRLGSIAVTTTDLPLAKDVISALKGLAKETCACESQSQIIRDLNKLASKLRRFVSAKETAESIAAIAPQGPYGLAGGNTETHLSLFHTFEKTYLGTDKNPGQVSNPECQSDIRAYNLRLLIDGLVAAHRAVLESYGEASPLIPPSTIRQLRSLVFSALLHLAKTDTPDKTQTTQDQIREDLGNYLSEPDNIRKLLSLTQPYVSATQPASRFTNYKEQLFITILSSALKSSHEENVVEAIKTVAESLDSPLAKEMLALTSSASLA